MQIVHEDEAAGSLELLDTTRLMRYKDDVAVRRVVCAGGDSAVWMQEVPRNWQHGVWQQRRGRALCCPCVITDACHPCRTPMHRVRRAADGGGVVVDVRSASRVGKGDLGCNAARIRQYLAALRGELGLSAS